MNSINKVPPEGSGERLREAIQKSGYTIERLAMDLNVETCTMSRYVNGKAAMNIAVCKRVCDVLGITPDWLIYGLCDKIYAEGKEHYEN